MIEAPYKHVYYVASGNNDTFAFPFQGINKDFVKVSVKKTSGEIIQNAPVRVNTNPDGSLTGTITFEENIPEQGAIVLIERKTPEEQNTPYGLVNVFNSQNIESSFDLTVAMLQEINDKVSNHTLNIDEFQDTPLYIDFVDESDNDRLFWLDFVAKKLKSTSFTQEEVQKVIDDAVRSAGLTVKNMEWDGKKITVSFASGSKNAVVSDNIVQIRINYVDNKYIFQYSLDGITWRGVASGMLHNDLLDRDAEDSHPISAITNLQSELDKKANGADVYDKSETYSKKEVDTALGKKANASTTYSKTEVDNALAKKLNIQQGASNVGKILKIGEDGNIIASSESGGLISVNHDDTLEGAGTDSSPLVIAGKEKLTNKVTNCILQLPRIGLSIQNGDLVLASGTKVYVANNGVSSLTTSSELTYSTDASSGQYMILLNGANKITSANLASCSSGTLAQRPTSTPTSTGLYYATDTQTMYNTSNNGSTWGSGALTLPIAIATVSNGQFTSVTPFNGVGYIGTTLFSVPGLLVSIPNGRSSDGTLNNATNPQTNVNFYTLESFTRTEIFAASKQLLAVVPNTYTYDFEQNKVFTATGDQRTIVKIGTVSNDGSTITGIDLDEPFAAVDYNEYVKDLSNINETLEDKASLSEPQTIGGKYTFTQTIDINDSLGMQINRALDSGGTTAWRVYDATNSRQIRALGFYANSKIYNRLSIVGKTGIEGYLNFSMTDDGTMNIELSGGKEYLPSKGSNNSSFATTKWVQIELGDYAQNDLSNVSSNIDYVVESQEPTASNNYTWYRKYKSGWVEQGGGTGQSNYIFYNSTVTFPVPFADMNYAINGVGFTISNVGKLSLQTKTTTLFTVASDTQQCGVGGWFACGMAA